MSDYRPHVRVAGYRVSIAGVVLLVPLCGALGVLAARFADSHGLIDSLRGFVMAGAAGGFAVGCACAWLGLLEARRPEEDRILRCVRWLLRIAARRAGSR